MATVDPTHLEYATPEGDHGLEYDHPSWLRAHVVAVSLGAAAVLSLLTAWALVHVPPV